MRIWFQSNTALHTDSIWRGYAAAIESNLNKIKRPDTVVRVAGVEKQEANLEGSAYDRYKNLRQILDRGLEAEKEGYDAFVMAGMASTGHEEIRAALSIPVVYAEAVMWSFSIWQYGRFGIIGHGHSTYFTRIEQIRKHGLLDRFVQGDYCNFRDRDLAAAFSNPQPVITQLRDSALRAVQDGAKVLVPSTNVVSDLLLVSGVTEFHGIPILNAGGVALKMGEFIVDASKAGLTQA